MHNDDELFQNITAEKFKEIGNSVLKTISILLTSPPQIITNENEKIAILKKFHDDPVHDGHCGQKRLYAKIRSCYFWKGMMNTVKKYVQTCHKCQVNKSYIKTKEEMTLTSTPQQQLDIVSVDTIGRLPISNEGNRYAVTIVCNLTKYFVSTAVPNKESATIAKAIFNSFISTYGPMKEMLTDLGTEY